MKRGLSFVLLFVVILFVCMVLFAACSKKNTQPSGTTMDANNPTGQKYKIGLITGFGGLGDKAFNDMEYNGVIGARMKFGVDFLYRSPTKAADDVPLIEELIAQGCNVIIAGGGFHQFEPVDILSRKYPNVIFILLDSPAKSYPPNLSAVVFRQNEGSYLAGALAALMSKTGVIGIVAAMNIDVINDFIVGYNAGAAAVSPQIRVIVNFIEDKYPEKTTGLSPFANPDGAYTLASGMYSSGNADVIFSVASASGVGIFNAAQEKHRYAIGVDSDQDFLAEGYILTSMMKFLDRSIMKVVEELIKGTLENRLYSFGLKEGGVDLSPMQYTRDKIPQGILERIQELKKSIINGTIIVPTAMAKAQ